MQAFLLHFCTQCKWSKAGQWEGLRLMFRCCCFLCLLDGQCNWGLGSFLPIDEGWTWVEEQVDYQWSCILWEEHLPRGEGRYMSDTLQTLLLVHIDIHVCALGDKFKKVVLFCLKWMPETIPYSGKFSWVQIFANNPVSSPEEIFAVLIFVFSASYWPCPFIVAGLTEDEKMSRGKG